MHHYAQLAMSNNKYCCCIFQDVSLCIPSCLGTRFVDQVASNSKICLGGKVCSISFPSSPGATDKTCSGLQIKAAL